MSNPVYKSQKPMNTFAAGLLFAAIAFIPCTIAYIWRTGGL